jgi:DNA (cytosine-5)-methyltransferase 1
MRDLDKFYGWLLKEKKYKENSAHDVLSRIRRVAVLIHLKENMTEDNLLATLSKQRSFQNLTPSVRSQLKRAVRLFKEFGSGDNN